MKMAGGDPELQCCSFDRTINSIYIMRGGNFWTRVLELEDRHQTEACSPVLVGWHILKVFAVSLKDRD